MNIGEIVSVLLSAREEYDSISIVGDEGPLDERRFRLNGKGGVITIFFRYATIDRLIEDLVQVRTKMEDDFKNG